MAERQQSPTLDAFGDDQRMRSVGVGALMTVFGAVIVVLDCALRWDRAQRPLLVAIATAAAVFSLLMTRLPVERIIRSRWREPFFLCWSGAMVAAVSLIVTLDGTDESPLALLFVLPLIFAASSYPLWPTLAVCVADVGAWLVVGVSDGGASVERALVLTALLTATGAMCVLQARNPDRQREALELISRTDPLTGVLNRRGFEERLSAALRTA